MDRYKSERSAAPPRDWAFLLAHDCVRPALDGAGVSKWPSQEAACMAALSKELRSSMRERVQELALPARLLADATPWLQRLPAAAKISRVSISHKMFDTVADCNVLDFLKALWAAHHPIQYLDIAYCVVDMHTDIFEDILLASIRTTIGAAASLRELRVRQDALDARGLAHLPAACPNLRVLDLEGVFNLGAAIEDRALDMRALPLTDLSIAVLEKDDMEEDDSDEDETDADRFERFRASFQQLFPASLRSFSLELGDWGDFDRGFIGILATLPALESLTLRDIVFGRYDQLEGISGGSSSIWFAALKHLTLAFTDDAMEHYERDACMLAASRFVDALPALRTVTLEDDYHYTVLSPQALSRLDEVRMEGSPMVFEDLLFYWARFLGPRTILRGCLYISVSPEAPTTYEFPAEQESVAPADLAAVKKAARAKNPALDPDRQLLLTAADGHGYLFYPRCIAYDYASENNPELFDRYGSIQGFF